MNGKKADPGWNDPPMLNYSPANPPPKSRITNKRVAFPLTAAAPGQTSSVPQPAAPPGPLSDWNSQERWRATVENFQMLINGIEVNERGELLQRLELLESGWSDGSLPQNVQKYVYEISVCLREKNVSKANELQLHLAMEHCAAHALWMGLIRRFVNKM